MSFRQRLMLLTAIAIAVTVAGASVALWVVAKHELFAQVDSTLQTQAVLAIRGPNNGPFGGRSRIPYNLVSPDGTMAHQELNLSVTDRHEAVAAGTQGFVRIQQDCRQRPLPRSTWRDCTTGGAVVVYQDLAPTDHALLRISSGSS